MNIIVLGGSGFIGKHLRGASGVGHHFLFVGRNISDDLRTDTFSSRIFHERVKAFDAEVVLDLATHFNLYPSFCDFESLVHGSLTFHIQMFRELEVYNLPWVYTSSFWQSLKNENDKAISDYHFLKESVERFLFQESSANVFHHGVLSQEDYLPIAAKCVVGIGSLNLMSLNMSEASPLKTRHYLAMGLPVISRYTDSDFGKQVPFILSLPSSHEPISTYAAEIREFCNIWSSKRVAREDIQVIDVHSKETNRIEFLRAITVGNS